jgi:hypothetical protein
LRLGRYYLLETPVGELVPVLVAGISAAWTRHAAAPECRALVSVQCSHTPFAAFVFGTSGEVVYAGIPEDLSMATPNLIYIDEVCLDPHFVDSSGRQWKYVRPAVGFGPQSHSLA